MKKVFTIITIIVVTILFGCGKGDSETTIDVRFISEPADGSNINSISSSLILEREFNDKSTLFEQKPSPKNVNMTFEWWWEAGDRSDVKLMQTETFLMDTDRERLDLTFSVESGFVLANYYWLKIIWEDDEGFQEVNSRKGFYNCTICGNIKNYQSNVKLKN